MIYFLFTLAIFLLVFLAMAIGYLLRRKSITGSCGGLDRLGIEKDCDCPEPCLKRRLTLIKARVRRGERIL